MFNIKRASNANRCNGLLVKTASFDSYFIASLQVFPDLTSSGVANAEQSLQWAWTKVNAEYT